MNIMIQQICYSIHAAHSKAMLKRTDASYACMDRTKSIANPLLSRLMYVKIYAKFIVSDSRCFR